MATNFPTTLDDNTTSSLMPDAVDTLAITDHTLEFGASRANNTRDAILAIEAKLGINNSAVTTSIDFMIRGRLQSNYADGSDQFRLLASSSSALTSGNLLVLGDTVTSFPNSFTTRWKVDYQGDWKTAKATTGDIWYASGANTVARLGIGSSNQVLTVSGGVPTWAAGVAAPLTLTLDDAVTNTVSTILTLSHTSSGTTAASFGARLLFLLEDASGNAAENAASIDGIWTTATNGSETSALVWSLRSAGAALAEVARLKTTGMLFATNGVGIVSSGGSGKVFTDDVTGTQLAYSTSTLTVAAASIVINNTFKPNADQSIPLGTSAARWALSYFAELNCSKTDAGTNTVYDSLQVSHYTSGTAAAGIGVGILLASQDTAGNVQNAGRVAAVLSTATSGSEESYLRFDALTAGGSLTEMARISGKMGLQLACGVSQNRVAKSGNYTAVATDGIIGYTSTAAAYTVTLPAANAVPAGWELLVKDESGAAGTNNITISRAGADTIDGGTSIAISTNYGAKAIYSDGSSKWFVRWSYG